MGRRSLLLLSSRSHGENLAGRAGVLGCCREGGGSPEKKRSKGWLAGNWEVA